MEQLLSSFISSYNPRYKCNVLKSPYTYQYMYVNFLNLETLRKNKKHGKWGM